MNSPEHCPVSVSLPPDVDEWLEERATAAGMDRAELLALLTKAYHEVVTIDETEGELLDIVEDVAADTAAERVDDRLGVFRSSLDDQLQTIHQRILQLKRESDERADIDRVVEIQNQVGELDPAVDELDEELQALRSTVETLDDEIEDIREDDVRSERTSGRGSEAMHDSVRTTADGEPHLDEAETVVKMQEQIADLESKVRRVAEAVVELRTQSNESHATDQIQADTTIDRIRRKAAREDIEDARCETCEATVNIALLPDLKCPHCGIAFDGLDVEPLSNTFGIASLFDQARLMTTETTDQCEDTA
jgi:chromosome segregation ATPase